MTAADTLTVVDVGGTHFRSAAWSPRSGLGRVRRDRSPGRALRPHDSVPQLQEALVEQLCAAVPSGGDPVAGVSLGAALDHRSGTAYASAPLWGEYRGRFDVSAALRARRPDVAWHVTNDVSAALAHRSARDQAAGMRRMMLITVSTGIACRTVDRSRGVVPVDGSGLQGEIGHLPARTVLCGRPVELTCDCGGPDHLAAFASGPGIRRLAAVAERQDGAWWAASGLGRRVAAGEEFGTALRAALDDGDDAARELLHAATGPVADLIRVASCLDPELDEIALGGGVVTGTGPHYRRALLEHLDGAGGLYLTSEHDPGWFDRRVVTCPDDEASCLVGAGVAALREQGRRDNGEARR